MALSKIRSDSVASGVIPEAKGKNILINGAATVHQRGNQTTTNGGAVYFVDRFNVFHNSSAAVANLQQSTVVPSGQGFGNSMLIDVTTADTSIAAGEIAILRQVIEGQNLQRLAYGTSSAKSLTISFWVRSTKTGTYILEIYHSDTQARNQSHSYTISQADTWEYKSITFSGDTSATIDNDNAATFYVQWGLFAGTDYNGSTLQTTWANFGDQTKRFAGQVNFFDSTSNNFYLTGVQLEVGVETPSPFEHEDYSTTLAKCRRYFIRYYGNDSPNFPRWFNPAYANDCYMGGNFSFPVQMRATPSVSASVTYQNSDGLGTGDVSREGVNLYVLSTGAATISGAYITNNSSDHVTIDAEL